MALVERIQESINVTKWEGQIPLNYRYTCGRAGEKFFREIKDNGKLFGARCNHCEITYLPPRIYCERCFSRLEESLIEIPPVGTVETYTICHEDFDGTRKEKPTIVAVIRLDQTDGGFVHWLGEVPHDKVRIGMKVEAVFKNEEEREGSILDIRYFKPSE